MIYQINTAQCHRSTYGNRVNPATNKRVVGPYMQSREQKWET